MTQAVKQTLYDPHLGNSQGNEQVNVTSSTIEFGGLPPRTSHVRQATISLGRAVVVPQTFDAEVELHP